MKNPSQCLFLFFIFYHIFIFMANKGKSEKNPDIGKFLSIRTANEMNVKKSGE